MAETVAVIITTFGDHDRWDKIAARAVASVERQTRMPDYLIRYHGDGGLSAARNQAAALTPSTDHLIFLDADDELDERYVEAMLASEGDIRQPSTLGIVNGVPDRVPYMIPEKTLLTGNYIVIGAMINTAMFHDVGGFDDYVVYEDWALWLKMSIVGGAKIGRCPLAIYKVHIDRKNGRNHATPAGERDVVQHQIEAHFHTLARERGLA